MDEDAGKKEKCTHWRHPVAVVKVSLADAATEASAVMCSHDRRSEDCARDAEAVAKLLSGFQMSMKFVIWRARLEFGTVRAWGFRAGSSSQ